jgi:hypothetical protein
LPAETTIVMPWLYKVWTIARRAGLSLSCPARPRLMFTTRIGGTRSAPLMATHSRPSITVESAPLPALSRTFTA